MQKPEADKETGVYKEAEEKETDITKQGKEKTDISGSGHLYTSLIKSLDQEDQLLPSLLKYVERAVDIIEKQDPATEDIPAAIERERRIGEITRKVMGDPRNKEENKALIQELTEIVEKIPEPKSRSEEGTST